MSKGLGIHGSALQGALALLRAMVGTKSMGQREGRPDTQIAVGRLCRNAGGGVLEGDR